MLIDNVRKTVSTYGMLRRGDTVVAAVSGGADSVALLNLLWSLQNALGISLLVAHLNHSIRGADADADAEFVQDLAANLRLRAIVDKVDVPALSKELKLGIEETAREARYSFLRRVAEESGASKIAVAHTADDQVETVLLNIIRGTGPDGLAGMSPVRGNIIRPLIDTCRNDLEDYLKENRLQWRTDASNTDTDYARNRIRHRLLPLLESEFNPRVRDAVLTLSQIVKDENEVVAAAALEAYKTALVSESPDSVEFDTSRLRSAKLALRRRCLRSAIARVKGDLRDVEYSQVERIVAALDSGTSVTLTLPSGLVYARVAQDRVTVFRRTLVAAPRPDFARDLALPGTTDVPELGVTIEATEVSPEARPAGLNEAVVDADKLAGKLIVRTWRDGDRIVPLGMTGHKKLQDLFTDKKVPRDARGLVPVICDEEKIVWVAGLVVSDAVRLTNTANSAFLIRCRGPI